MNKVEFTLEGDPQVYALAYDFNEIADAEEVAKCNLLSAMANIWGMTATQMRGLLYACLRPNHPTVLLPEAGALLTRDSGTVMAALAKVLGAEDAPAPKIDEKGQEGAALAAETPAV